MDSNSISSYFGFYFFDVKTFFIYYFQTRFLVDVVPVVGKTVVLMPGIILKAVLLSLTHILRMTWVITYLITGAMTNAGELRLQNSSRRPRSSLLFSHMQWCNSQAFTRISLWVAEHCSCKILQLVSKPLRLGWFYWEQRYCR